MATVNYLQKNIFTLTLCSDVVGGQYTNIYSTVKDVYLKLLSLGVRALVYNGDTDMACNFLGDKWFVEQLNQKVKLLKTGIWVMWYRDLDAGLQGIWHVCNSQGMHCEDFSFISRQPPSTRAGYLMTRLPASTSSMETSPS